MVAKAGQKRLQRKSRRVPIARRPEKCNIDAKSCHDTKTASLQKRRDVLLASIRTGGKYVDFTDIAFKLTKTHFPFHLHLTDADEYSGNCSLDTYMIFSVVGYSSNGNLDYICVCGNESNETWTRVWAFVYCTFPGIGRITTVADSGDHGIFNGLELVFGENVSPQIASSNHRAGNLQRHESVCVSVFYCLTNSKTVEALPL